MTYKEFLLAICIYQGLPKKYEFFWQVFKEIRGLNC